MEDLNNIIEKMVEETYLESESPQSKGRLYRVRYLSQLGLFRVYFRQHILDIPINWSFFLDVHSAYILKKKKVLRVNKTEHSELFSLFKSIDENFNQFGFWVTGKDVFFCCGYREQNLLKEIEDYIQKKGGPKAPQISKAA